MALLAALTASVCSAQTSKAPANDVPQLINRVVAVVNNDVITAN